MRYSYIIQMASVEHDGFETVFDSNRCMGVQTAINMTKLLKFQNKDREYRVCIEEQDQLGNVFLAEIEDRFMTGPGKVDNPQDIIVYRVYNKDREVLHVCDTLAECVNFIYERKVECALYLTVYGGYREKPVHVRIKVDELLLDRIVDKPLPRFRDRWTIGYQVTNARLHNTQLLCDIALYRIKRNCPERLNWTLEEVPVPSEHFDFDDLIKYELVERGDSPLPSKVKTRVKVWDEKFVAGQNDALRIYKL